MKNAAMMKKNAPRFPDYKKAVVFNDGKLTVVPQKAPDTKEYKQKQLQIVCDYLGYEGISTHSFRKWYATEIYKANGYDIALVQRLLQHSSATTQRYIGIEPQRIEQAIQNHAQLL